VKKVALVIVLFTWTLTTHGKYSASGDEPHYLMITQSLAADHDLDLANNYANDDGRLFGHAHLDAGPHVARNRQGEVESVHGVGLPILIVPAYAGGRALAAALPTRLLARFRMDRGLFAYSIVSLCLIVLTACAMATMALSLASSVGALRSGAWITAAAISPPIVSHSFLVFPEVIALSVTCFVVSFAAMGRSDREHGLFLVLAATLGCLPSVHRKFLFYVWGLLFLMVWLRRDVVQTLSARERLLAGALFLLPQIALLASSWATWGTFAGPQMVDGVPLSLSTMKEGLAGLWLDRQSGLLAYAPLYWLVPAAWIITWRRTWPYLIPAMLLYLPMASFLEWWGGFAPAARYLVPIVPLCLVPMLYAFRVRAVRYAAAALLVPQLAIDVVVWQHPRALWPGVPGANAALDHLGALGHAYANLFPMWR
jgi:hypothetical protein